MFWATAADHRFDQLRTYISVIFFSMYSDTFRCSTPYLQLKLYFVVEWLFSAQSTDFTSFHFVQWYFFGSRLKATLLHMIVFWNCFPLDTRNWEQMGIVRFEWNSFIAIRLHPQFILLLIWYDLLWFGCIVCLHGLRFVISRWLRADTICFLFYTLEFIFYDDVLMNSTNSIVFLFLFFFLVLLLILKIVLNLI